MIDDVGAANEKVDQVSNIEAARHRRIRSDYDSVVRERVCWSGWGGDKQHKCAIDLDGQGVGQQGDLNKVPKAIVERGTGCSRR